MKKNRRPGMLKYDLEQGLRVNLWKYLLGILPFVFSVWQSADIMIQVDAESKQPAVFDCLLYLFKGMKVYIPARGMIFEIPILWMSVQIFVGMIIYNFPKDDFDKYGMQTMIRVHSKAKWWFSKYIWTIVSVVLFYILGYGSIVLLCILNGRGVSVPDSVWNLQVNEIDILSLSAAELWILCIILPVLTSAALAVLQMTISFLLNPIYSYVIMLSYTIISVYYYKPIFIGANSMILRNSLIVQGGTGIMEIVIIDCAVIVLAGVLGYWHFRRMDVLVRNLAR